MFKLLPENMNNWGVWYVVEHCIAKYMVKGIDSSHRADSYIAVGDDFACIMLEVDKMRLDKWDFYKVAKDDKPVRVLRVSIYRQAHLMHPRKTEQEIKFMDFISEHLQRIQGEIHD